MFQIKSLSVAAVIVAIAHVARAELTPGVHYCIQDIKAAGFKDREIWQIIYSANLETPGYDNLLFTYKDNNIIGVNKTCSRGCYGRPGGAVCIPDRVPKDYKGDIAEIIAKEQRE
ncbi:hypothetical protein E4U13_001083 [Claviceps humidiphila]|uniref:Uncharacterized protein n=1 Tax=Claviceps humidiphila TaxID=1294629 RepID=A0A9P7TYH7_9HYPO|nr:hypothetical protein E4U13_001083 [Claviceps humidiphila]